MKIVEVELVNHVVLPPTFYVNFRDYLSTDVVCIDGWNGSGKSFTINNIHPLSSNKRFSNKYPIVKGKNGMKRIVYELSPSTEFEIIHEYVVNGSRHSCKSYCNMYVNKVKSELNPTGHTKLFEELIKQYLNFDSNTFTTALLNPKLDNIVNSTPTRRKEILESTIKGMTILNSAKNNNRSLITENTALVKLYSKQIESTYQKLEYKSISEFDESITSIRNNISLVENRIEQCNLEKSGLSSILSDLNKEKSIDTEMISDFIRILEDYKYDSMKSAFSDMVELRSSIVMTEKDIEFSIKESEIIRKRIELLIDRESIYDKIITLKDKTNSIKQKLSGIVKGNILDLDMHSLGVVIGSINGILSISWGGTPCPNSLESLDLAIKDIEKELDLVNGRIVEFEKCLDTEFGESHVPYTPSCELCTYFIKYEKTKRFVEEFQSRYLEDKGRQEVLMTEITDMTNMKRVVDTLSKPLAQLHSYITLSSMPTKPFELMRLICSGGSLSSVLNTPWISIRDEFNTMIGYDRTIETLEIKLAASETHGNINELQASLTDMKTKIRESTEWVEMEKPKVNRIRSLVDYTTDPMVNLTIDELRAKYSYMQVLDQTISENLNKLNNIESQLNEHKTKIHNLRNKLNQLEISKNQLLEFSEYLKDTKSKLEILKVVKDILEKKIPTHLLMGNIDFIESMVNSILEDNDISISIDIVVEDDNIRISVNTKNQEVDDIAMCSSGELCILAVVLNATIAHMIGYPIISFDEMDSNLDIINKEKFSSIIYSIMERLDISQIFCVSHNISFDLNVTHLVLGDYNTDGMHGEVIRMS